MRGFIRATPVLNRTTGIALLLIASLLFVSCSSSARSQSSDKPAEASLSQQETTASTNSSTETAAPSDSASKEETNAPDDDNATATPAAPTEESKGSVDSPEAMEIPTPYQYLALMAGNAESLTFSYFMKPVEGEGSEGLYERRADLAAASYTAIDMNGKALEVRELALQDETFFIVPVKKAIYRYEGIVPHLIEAELLAALQGTAGETLLSDGAAVTTFTVPLPQDPDTPVAYAFTMTKDGLKEVKISVAGELHRTVTFGDFLTDDVPESHFVLPKDLPVERFDYPFDQAQMPPWWEGDDTP